MPVAQSETAFRTRPAVHSIAVPAMPATRRPVTPARTGTARQARTKQRPQTLWLLLIVVAACFCGSVGLIYLSSYAHLAREGYRRSHLLSELRAEQERERQLQQIKAQLTSPTTIERKAHALHMIATQTSDTLAL